ncbi:MAG: hypothetical protein ABI883_05475 [Chthoniobacterales bacterium]
MEELAPNVWLLRYPLRFLGIPAGRNVTVLRLASGALVIHSTAPFSTEDVRRIRALGEPKWLLDVTRFHDSYASAGRAAFPDVTYLAPEVFPERERFRIVPFASAPPEWGDELELCQIDGMPKVQEHALFHAPSRTLLVGDLFFNFGETSSWWARVVIRYLMRLPELVGMSLAFRLMIRDRQAFLRSVAEIMRWDFDRVIVGHGQVIESGGKERLREVLAKFGLV